MVRMLMIGVAPPLRGWVLPIGACNVSDWFEGKSVVPNLDEVERTLTMGFSCFAQNHELPRP